MKINMKIVFPFLTLFILGPAVVMAGEKGLDQVMNMIMEEMRNSSDFNESMACLGVSEQKKKNYLEQFEKDYRFCLSKFPQNKDGGDAFLACFSPKADSALDALGIEESVVKKCNS